MMVQSENWRNLISIQFDPKLRFKYEMNDYHNQWELRLNQFFTRLNLIALSIQLGRNAPGFLFLR
ncbi:hypothetical protein D3C80_1191040 [compost metagenome]